MGLATYPLRMLRELDTNVYTQGPFECVLNTKLPFNEMVTVLKVAKVKVARHKMDRRHISLSKHTVKLKLVTESGTEWRMYCDMASCTYILRYAHWAKKQGE